ncbi:TM0106 family RecB-like putative nuclease [Glaciihabitans sp. UYNi722]|uniref:TM0106 family RecB-like putative nuclease n=1 Tax=Glaciihabitans sp. UYNi722 TaxID=3156344 RepID=UPI0033992F39
MRKLDAKLGRIPMPTTVDDDMLERTARLGDAHELRYLEELRLTRQVVEIERPGIERIAEAAAQSEAAFAGGAEVVYQAAFFDGRFLGYADFIIRDDAGSYEVYDTKLARHAKIIALLQLAAYSEQLQRLGIPTGEFVHLLLGDQSTSSHRLRDILPVYRKRRARLEQMVDERVADRLPTEWGDPRYAPCGRCDACEEQVQLHRDVLLVAGLHTSQRMKLRAAGIDTIEQLAEADSVDGISDATLATLRRQARLQLEPGALAWRVTTPAALAALPEPNAGDVFFDFEGDPLYQEGAVWGLDYLFGLVEPDETFRAFWAHDLVDERQALVDFLDYIDDRRARHPGMHVYHYAAYERTHLLTLAARHGVGEERVADLLREHVLVDLYPIVRRALVIGSRSYSLKKLEPLYMGDRLREGVANAADSITEYVRSRELLEAGEADAATAVLADIADYNAYDCVSTLRLRDWLLDRAADSHVALASPADLEIVTVEREPDQVYLDLSALIDAVPPTDRTPDETAISLAAAAIDYHRRENNSFWWDHYDRLRQPIDDWQDTRDVFRIEAVTVMRGWSIEGRDRSLSRELLVTGTPALGSSFSIGRAPYLAYEIYQPAGENIEPGARYAHSRAKIIEVVPDGLVIEEKLPKAGDPYDDFPMALTPSSPPRAKVLADAIHYWGDEVLRSWPAPIPDAAFDILRRAAPRGTLSADADTQSAIRESLLTLDRSYLAVQGPPGTGKTYVGSHVIADLVRDHGWKVGVVAQSHAAVENMLGGVVKAGLDPALVGKVPRAGDSATVPWTTLSTATLGAFTAQPGFVVGGTAWTFANANHIPRDSLDLLVIDEAGQYSLANTIAASVSAQRLLLLGDPQQLPQVSQGTHPEPVDVSALGWLSAGHDVLPPQFGYFLETSWRMHPDLCAPVSALSYEGRLHSYPSDRSLAGVAPGLHAVPVEHRDNATSSPEEADAVVALVRDLLDRAWTSGGSTRPLEQRDVIVVAPYNAQVELLRERLAEADLDGVSVGTVDRFQGREAAVAIVSLTASSAADVPRGIEFLLMANRLNVAISRAQWAAYLLYSPALTEFLPTNIDGLAQLSAFVRLVEGE